MYVSLIFLFLLKNCLTLLAELNSESTLRVGCLNVTAASVNTTQLRGSWYIQKYTGPTDKSPLQTKCDFMDIFLYDKNGTLGYVNYTFYPYKRMGDLQVQVANLTTLPEVGTYRYAVHSPDFAETMHATILHLTEDSLVQVACSETQQTLQHIVIASRRRQISNETLSELVQRVKLAGLNSDLMQDTDLTDCHYMVKNEDLV